MGTAWKLIATCIWTQHSATGLFSSWQCSPHCQCYRSGLLKHSGFVLKRNKITFKKLFIMAYLPCLAWCCAIHFTFALTTSTIADWSVSSAFALLKSHGFYLICDGFPVNFTGIWFCLSMEGAGAWTMSYNEQGQSKARIVQEPKLAYLI